MKAQAAIAERAADRLAEDVDGVTSRPINAPASTGRRRRRRGPYRRMLVATGILLVVTEDDESELARDDPSR